MRTQKRYLFIVVSMMLLFVLLVSTRVYATPSASPTVDSAQVETFTGPDFVDFWWDPANISGCYSITLWRKASYETNYTAVANPACNAGLYTDSSVVAGTTYSYQFSVQNDATPPVTIYLDYISATPGEVGGKLHRYLSLGGDLTVGGINVGENAQLILSNATITPVWGTASIHDWINNPDGSVREQGSVLVTGGTFDSTNFDLNSAESTIDNCIITNASVNTHADVQNSTFDNSSIGFADSGSAKLSGNTITGTIVTVVDSFDADIQSNTFTNGSQLSLRGSANAAVSGNTFTDSVVWVQDQVTANIETNAFSGSIPGSFDDTVGFINIEADTDITIFGNTLYINDAVGTHPVIRVDPATTPSNGTIYSISNNTLIGSDAGTGIRVYADSGITIPNVEIANNTSAHFTKGTNLTNNSYDDTGVITATLTNNTFSGNVYGIYADVHGASNTVIAHNNCIAGNTTAGIRCGNTGNVIDATDNYWGHSTGPTHSSNPDGLGDVLWCSDAATEINYSPWLESHACYIHNLAIANIEVVQVVQSISNTIPLVAEKETIARVFPAIDAGFATISGSLTGFRDGVELGTIQSNIPIQAGSITDWDVARADASSSFIFDLPQEWLHGVVTLRAEVTTASNPPIRCTAATATAVTTETVTFHERAPIEIAYIPAPVNVYSKYISVTPDDIIKIHQNIVAHFPFGPVTYRILPAADRYTTDLVSSRGYLFIALLTRRWEIKYNHDNVADYYITVYGTDDPDEYTGTATFSPRLNSIVSCGLHNAGQDCAIDMGVRMGLRPLYFEPEDMMSPYNYDFPYPDNLTHEFGYDVVRGAIQPPDLHDLMSLEALDSPLSWMSDFHYEKVYLNLEPTPKVIATTTTTGDYLYINGLAGPTAGYFYPVTLLENSPQPDDVTPVNPAGEYCLRSLDAFSQVLEETCFDLNLTNVSTGADDQWTLFTATLTPNPDIHYIMLLHNGGSLRLLTVPDSPPNITLISADYDSTYKMAQIAWLTTPLEAHANLRYHFQYSADNGATWIPIAINIHPDRIPYYDDAFHWRVSAAQIPSGTQAKLRLIASDGFNETTVTSAAFTVPDVGPWLDIVSPANDAVIDTFPIVLDGYAYDIENGDRSAVMTWTSSVDGLLGSGDNLSVATLSSGSHIITLSADDGDGNIGTDTIHITVGSDSGGGDGDAYSIYLPLVLK